MIAKLGNFTSKWSERLVPDPFVLAIILTFVTFASAVLFAPWYKLPKEIDAASFTDAEIAEIRAMDESAIMPATEEGGPRNVVKILPASLVGLTDRLVYVTGYWYRGLFGNLGLMTFALQMCLVLVTGTALAESRAVRKLLDRLAGIPTSSAQAAWMVSLIAMTTALLNWGFGLVVGAIMAKEVATSCKLRGIRVSYPVLGAAGYAGLLVWHGGLSGSAPLKEAATVPFTESVLGAMNLGINFVLLLAIPWTLSMLVGSGGDDAQIPDSLMTRELPASLDEKKNIATSLNRSKLLALVLVILAVVALFGLFEDKGAAGIDLSSVIAIFLFLGILLHGGLQSYSDAISRGSNGAAGIVLQFPFYFAIFGIISAEGTGLVSGISNGFASVSQWGYDSLGIDPRHSFPVLTFLSASVVNLFVPSGGGQWAIQGPIAFAGAERIGLPKSIAMMSVCYGDQLTNMLQPFWALPLLAITGLRARQIIGYTTLLMLIAAPVFVIGLILFS
ncbi:MAG: TIGR00366 family protein [Planctomycetes bacterium]|nr:TIGR00366 family protein [Planctomycetota bacterium]